MADFSLCIGFRLYSSSSIKPISLSSIETEYSLPTSVWQLTTILTEFTLIYWHRNPRSTDLTPHQNDLLHRRAAEAAVTYPDLGGPSIKCDESRRIDSFKVRADGPLPRIFIGRRKRFNMPNDTLTGVPSINLIGCRDASKDATSAKRRLRKRKTSRPLARYWQPPHRLGGKSQGYAYGYGWLRLWTHDHQRDRLTVRHRFLRVLAEICCQSPKSDSTLTSFASWYTIAALHQF